MVRPRSPDGAPGLCVYALGPPLSAPGGYSDDRPDSYKFGFHVRGAAAADAMFAQLAETGPFAVWPIHH